MKQFLSKLYSNETLSETEAYDALFMLASGEDKETQMTGFITAFIIRRPSVAELSGFRAAMLQLCNPLSLLPVDATDIVGTGGDGKNSFNISTLSAIVAAAAGCKIVKHGSYGASSMSGSSNVLEHLGYRFLSNEAALQKQLDDAGICFLHAPLFHPAMKNVAPVRKNIGVSTFFNLLGPLINPAQPSRQVLGVNNLETARTYNYMMQKTGCHYAIIHSLDGYDEISLTSPFKIITRHGEEIYSPEDIGFGTLRSADLDAGNTVADAAAIFMKVLQGNATAAQRSVVVANSAWAIHTAKPHQPIIDCIAQSTEALVSGSALKTFKQLLK